MRASGSRQLRAMKGGETRSPASLAAARGPQAATPPRRRVRLRIFVVRCSLPCDPPVGGHSCEWRDDTTPRAYGHFDEAWVKPASSRVKIHAVVDSSGLPVRLALTTGEAHDNRLPV